MSGERNSNSYYTVERNAQILIYLLKAHNIKKIVISPGATNICFVYSIQHDSYFELYSAADERSAAYIACGLAEESGEPVALSCTGATASRNYVPGLTEAYYRKLPVLAITSSQPINRIGHNIPQVTDRRNPMDDIARLSVNINAVKSQDEEWECEIGLNKALIELKERQGPAHINLVTEYKNDYSIRKLPGSRVIHRIRNTDSFPGIPEGKIGIFVGAHSRWNKELTELVDRFCSNYDAVVIADHTGNYRGDYYLNPSLIYAQEIKDMKLIDFDLMIHIGNVSGAYYYIKSKEVWRVSEDGAICDTFRKLTKVFKMEEEEFFRHYLTEDGLHRGFQLSQWEAAHDRIYNNIPDIPFSNVWVAKNTISLLPENAVLHLGILNSLRAWNLFDIPKSVNVYANTGGFGIDGCVSSLIGASLYDSSRLYFGVVGDLAFFYDMNSLGNHHIGTNLRLLVVNNNGGAEFKIYNHVTSAYGNEPYEYFENEINKYIAAQGHYGAKSEALLKNYAENLGFEYLAAHRKEEYEAILHRITSPVIGNKPMLVEIFTESGDESEALRLIHSINGSTGGKEQTLIVDKPKRLKEKTGLKNLVMFGTGGCYKRNYQNVMAYGKVQYVCDNNDKLWGRELAEGVRCISPEKLRDVENVYVIIMLEDARNAFSITNQLLDIGIRDFDFYYNWIKYADKEDYSQP